MAQHGILRAQSYILDFIASAHLGPGDLLPGLQELSKKSGISYATLWKAVDNLREQKILGRGSRRRAMVVKTASAHLPASSSGGRTDEPSPSQLWQKIARRIEIDILQQVYSPGQAIPSLKELCVRYRVSPPTIKKACDLLTAQNIIEPRGRGFVVPHLGAHTHSNASVVLIAQQAQPFKHYAPVLGNWGAQLMQHIEQTCAQNRLRLDIVVCPSDSEQLRFVNYRTGEDYDFSRNKTTLGYIHTRVWPTTPSEAILRRVLRTKLPVAYIEQAGRARFPRDIAAHPGLKQILLGASDKAGETVARYLLQLGHKHAAFFSPFNKAGWSLDRQRKIEEMYARAGDGHSLTSFCIDRMIEGQYAADGARNSDMQRLSEFYAGWKTQLAHEYTAAFDPIIDKMATLDCATAEIYHQLLPLFKKALSDRKITAWICANDLVAGHGLDFAKRAGVKIPERLSIIGFDDSAIAVANSLTSYNFNAGAVAQEALRTILFPKQSWSSRARTPVEIEGCVVERNTTKLIK